jgi:hypothetical protein
MNISRVQPSPFDKLRAVPSGLVLLRTDLGTDSSILFRTYAFYTPGR